MSQRTKPSPCYKCKYRVPIPGNYHIGCSNKQAQPVRKLWPGCGLFPVAFDPNTVFDCSVSEEGAPQPPDQDPLSLLRLLAGRS